MLAALALLSIHKSPVVPLADICERYFSLSYPEALRKAARNELPVPVFRLTESRKSPMVVSCQALGDFIDQQAEAARKAWSHSQPV